MLKIVRWLIGPVSQFRVGESVQHKSGNELMVVVKIYSSRKMSQPLIECQWYDSETKSSRKNLFPEVDLKPFDWYAQTTSAHPQNKF
jgi:uncharacterized protein YodC (DUF2158 family)